MLETVLELQSWRKENVPDTRLHINQCFYQFTESEKAKNDIVYASRFF